MIYLFLVDTGASMNQMAHHGMTYLESCKAAMEYFVKIRGNRADLFYLVNCEEGLSAVKAWQPRPAAAEFLNQVKNLQAIHLSNIGPALKTCFDLLNLHRIQQSTDNYGAGRLPWSAEPAVIILLSNGKLNSNDGLLSSLKLPSQPHQPGSELTKDPFRWDQKLFSIALRFPGFSSTASIRQYTTIAGNSEGSVPVLPVSGEAEAMEPTAMMCKVTGGKCFRVHAMKELLTCMEQIITHHSQGGVTVNFEKYVRIGESMTDSVLKYDSALPNIPQSASHVTIYRQSQLGFWPIPEAYMFDAAQPKLVSRTAQPIICFLPIQFDDFGESRSFPIDKYIIERCALTDWMAKNRPGLCWPVCIPNSSKGKNEPFGYIKVTPTEAGLFVLPFNFPRLWPLLGDGMMKMPSIRWKQEFDAYLNSIPPYYAQPLSKALKRFGFGFNPVPDHMDGALPYAIMGKMKGIKIQSKKEMNRWNTAIREANVPTAPVGSGALFTSPKPHEKAKSYAQVALPSVTEDLKSVFEISRESLLDSFQRTRSAAHSQDLQGGLDKKHNMPIAIMGNYQDTMLKREFLRNVNDDSKKRPLFGNPYRNEKSPARIVANNFVDEAESGDKAAEAPQEKEKALPIPVPEADVSQNPLIAPLLKETAHVEPEPKTVTQEKPPILQQETHEDVQAILNGNLSGMELFLAKRRVREHNVEQELRIHQLLRGRKRKTEGKDLLAIIMNLQGTKDERRKMISALQVRCRKLHKNDTAEALRQLIDATL